MAQTVIENNNTVVTRPSWVWLGRVIGFGAGIGLLMWILMMLIGQYVVEPLVCREVTTGSTCASALVTSGKIGTVIAAVLGVLAMTKFHAVRPVVVAISAAAVLWLLPEWIQGMTWYEAIFWAVLLYAAAYGLFGWIAHHISAAVSVVTAIVVTVLIRLALILT
ncbi:hypothetical protein B7Z17_00760 [Candidatus Saccharibacteria bacterium 32-49-10]|nr:MAG: hypothetical protein B7Z17_00760 [Candidatus Saccharibacteria bacterium 32-49-10]